ncbi:MAG: hypothetical protein U0271_07585 [Polyangiaceae bacterium]
MLAAVALAGGLLVAPRAAHASDEREVDHALKLVESAQYEAAAKRFATLLSATGASCPPVDEVTSDGCRLTSRDAITRARGLFAMVLVILDRATDAHAEMRRLLTDTPTFVPSPAIYTQKLIDLYVVVKEELRKEEEERIRQEKERLAALASAQKAYDDWVSDIEKLAATETVVTEKTRWLAAVPFGVGQFYNDDIGLGVLFLSAEGLFATSSIVTGVMWAQQVECASELVPSCISEADRQKGVDTTELNTKLDTLRIVNYVSVGLLVATVIAGIIEAEVSFKPTASRTRPRPLPPKPPKPPTTLSVTGVPGADDALGLGLMLRF